MERGMHGLLADVNVQEHLPYLRRLMKRCAEPRE
jgi:hypothetical protein